MIRVARVMTSPLLPTRSERQNDWKKRNIIANQLAGKLAQVFLFTDEFKSEKQNKRC